MKLPNGSRLASLFLALFLVIAALSPHFRTTSTLRVSPFLHRSDGGGIIIRDTVLDETSWEDLDGFWQSVVFAEALRLLVRFDVKEKKISLYSLDQGAGLIPSNGAKFSDKRQEFHIDFDIVDGSFKGKLDPTKQFLSGIWYQHGFHVPLKLKRCDDAVPREFRFLIEKEVTGDPAEIQKLVGYWSGHLDDSFDEDEPEEPELVIVEIEKHTDDLVEPKVHLPDETPLPSSVRSFVFLEDEGTAMVKLVVDVTSGVSNAIFVGHLDDEGHTLTGEVQYDDTDYKPPLVLTWSAERPDRINS